MSNGESKFSGIKNTGKTCTVKSLVIVSFLLFLDTRLDSTYMSWRNFSCLPPTTTNTDHQLLPSLYRCCKRVAGGQLATPAQNLKATTQSDQPMVTAADVVDSSDGQLFLAIDQANHISFDVIATTLQCVQFNWKWSHFSCAAKRKRILFTLCFFSGRPIKVLPFKI